MLRRLHVAAGAAAELNMCCTSADFAQHRMLLRLVMLMRLFWLQELAAELKAEVREVLKQHGVDNFVLKPVRRSYAFELAEVPRGEQWALKVRYPASKPSLPLGLSGKPPPPLNGSVGSASFRLG